jgi:hypothetical protein
MVLLACAAPLHQAMADPVCTAGSDADKRVREASEAALKAVSGMEVRDETYVKALEQAFDSSMRACGETNPEAYRPLSGPILSRDPEYIDSLVEFYKQYAAPPAQAAADGGRVIGGREAADSTDVVAILADADSEARRRLSLCSGVLIKLDRVLTAAHCICPIRDLPIEVRTGTRVFHGGGYDSRGVTGIQFYGGAAVCPAKSFATFEERYSGAYRLAVQEKIQGKDFAVLQLDEAVPASARSILDAAEFDAAAGARPKLRPSVAGYGFDRPGAGAGFRRWGRIAVADWRCNKVFGDCARGRDLVAASLRISETATCNHDSGGPLYVFVNEKAKLAGITSRNVTQKCGEGAIYGIVSNAEVLKWLSDIGAR